MKTTNIGEFKDNLGKLIRFIKQGEVIEIHKCNIPIAKIIPYETLKSGNRTVLGCSMGSVKILGDLTEPLIPKDTWDMHKS
jgi:antitoxin (DNA-binding transcriptional repressor) of toxin-antitoxin stability system